MRELNKFSGKFIIEKDKLAKVSHTLLCEDQEVLKPSPKEQRMDSVAIAPGKTLYQ